MASSYDSWLAAWGEAMPGLWPWGCRSHGPLGLERS
eukprot:CAMPEP_0197921528 /NCGR_PEP_ID=MMETSP1439-20131203/90795_1 /TAXON_ID=66791 /ORGANISM="Gonyaulax spinifera, Strain CCMP409" /LENGTH=35 /DNA_ID= /DNA_START= /DNA_END= /DNA_ORIENTATION=